MTLNDDFSIRRAATLNDDFSITSEIPSPPRTRGRAARYPFSEMKIGDSFFAPTWERGDPRRGNPRDAAYKYGQKNKKLFVTRAQSGGVRIWRIL